jgi:hypothetical protein
MCWLSECPYCGDEYLPYDNEDFPEEFPTIDTFYDSLERKYWQCQFAKTLQVILELKTVVLPAEYSYTGVNERLYIWQYPNGVYGSLNNSRTVFQNLQFSLKRREHGVCIPVVTVKL